MSAADGRNTVQLPLLSREFEERDLEGALRLWEGHADWGRLTEEQWRSWYRDTPHGDCLIVVTVDALDDVVGQVVFMPSMLRVGERDVRAYRLSAPILSPALRAMPVHSPHHPLRQMLEVGLGGIAARGAEIAYALPWYKWLPLINGATQRGIISPRTTTARIPCIGFGRDSWGAQGEHVEGTLNVERVTEFTDEYTALWERAVAAFGIGCSVVRSAGVLRFRSAGFLNLAVRDRKTGELVGYGSIQPESGLLRDLVASSPSDLLSVVEGLAGWLHRNPPEHPGFRSLHLMEAAPMRILRSSPYCEDVDHLFGFFAILFGQSGNDPALDVENWLISPSD